MARKQQERSPLELLLQQHLDELGVEYEPEYRFHPTRKWRVDFALVGPRIAIEVEGAIWTAGRHTRGSGFIKDIDKYNALALAGWRLLRFHAKQINSMEAKDTIRSVVCQN